MIRRVCLVLVFGVATVLAACGGGEDGGDAAPASESAAVGPVPAPPVIPAPLPPPPVVTPSSAASDPVAGTTVVLDPGHNGGNAANPTIINRQVPDGRGGTKACNTTGAATNAGYPEHAFTWDVAGRVRDILAARGVVVIMTRADDDGAGPCVDERAAVGNRAGAAAQVSIHADGAAPSGRGFHVIYSSPPLNAAQQDTSLARSLAQGMRDGGFVNSTYRGAGGLDPRTDIAGMNSSTIPAAMVECANLRNPDEAAAASTPDGRARYARAIANGILAWLAAR